MRRKSSTNSLEIRPAARALRPQSHSPATQLWPGLPALIALGLVSGLAGGLVGCDANQPEASETSEGANSEKVDEESAGTRRLRGEAKNPNMPVIGKSGAEFKQVPSGASVDKKTVDGEKRAASPRPSVNEGPPPPPPMAVPGGMMRVSPHRPAPHVTRFLIRK